MKCSLYLNKWLSFGFLVVSVLVTSASIADTIWIEDIEGCTDDVITVEVWITNDTIAIDAITMNIVYDTSMLTYVECSAGDLNPGWLYFACNENTPGNVRVMAFTVGPTIPTGSTGSIALLEFQVTCSGCSNGDSSVLEIAHTADDLSTFTRVNGLFTFNCGGVTPTPVPPTWTPTVVPTEPPPTWTPTNTPIPPTETPTDTPTEIPTELPSETPTPLPSSTPSTGTLSGHVILQRPGVTPPSDTWIIDISVVLCSGGSEVAEYSSQTDNSGYFSVEAEAGIFDILVKGSHTLANRSDNILIPHGGTTDTVEFGELREGDASDDNFVTSSDFFILRNSYNTVEGDDLFDPRADFNEDSTVTSTDFFLLRNQYNQSGQSCN